MLRLYRNYKPIINQYNRYFSNFDRNNNNNNNNDQNNRIKFTNNSNSNNKRIKDKDSFFEELEWSSDIKKHTEEKDDDLFSSIEWKSKDEEFETTLTTTTKARQNQEVEFETTSNDQDITTEPLPILKVKSKNYTIKQQENLKLISNETVQDSIKTIIVKSIPKTIVESKIYQTNAYGNGDNGNGGNENIIKNNNIPIPKDKIIENRFISEPEYSDELFNNQPYLLESIQTCIDRFSFIIKRNELKQYDIVFVFNKKYKYIELGYIGENDIIVDSNNNNSNNGKFKLFSKSLTDGYKEYEISDIIGCFPFSCKRENYKSIYNEFIQSVVDMNIVSVDQIKYLSKFTSKQLTPDNLHSTYGDMIYTVETFFSNVRRLPFFVENEISFHLDYKSTTTPTPKSGDIINGYRVPVDSSIKEWANLMNVVNETQLTEAASIFYEKVRYKSPWADVLLYYTFLRMLTFRNTFRLESKNYFSFSSVTHMLKLMDSSSGLLADERCRKIFVKHCCKFLSETFKHTHFRLNQKAYDIMNDKSIPLISSLNQLYYKSSKESMVIPKRFEELKNGYVYSIIRFYSTTDFSHLNGFNHKVFKTLLYDMGAHTMEHVDALVQDLFKRNTKILYKTKIELQLSYQNSILIKDTPTLEFKSSKQKEISNGKRIGITNRSFAFIQDGSTGGMGSVESSIGIANYNKQHDFTTVHIHIPDFTDSIKPGSNIDTLSLLKSSSLCFPNSTRTCLPPNVIKDSKLDSSTTNVCLTLELKIDKFGKLKSQDVLLTTVDNVLIDSFKNYQNLINDQQQTGNGSFKMDGNDSSQLLQLLKVAKLLRNNRLVNGFESEPENTNFSNIIFDNGNGYGSGESISLEIFNKSVEQSRIIFEEFRYLTNHAIAQYATDNKIVIPYILSENNRNEILNPIISGSTISKPYRYKNLSDYESLTIQQPYNTNSGSGRKRKSNSNVYQHQVTGYNVYSSIFSPLNNYLDLFVLREIKQFKMDKPSNFNTEQMEPIVNYLNENLKTISYVRSENQREWSDLYFKNLKDYQITFDSVLLNGNEKPSEFILLNSGLKVFGKGNNLPSNPTNQILKLKKFIDNKLFFSLNKE